MKLYFYFLESIFRGKKKINVEECEVAETPKTYKIIGKIPAGYYRSTVTKRDVNRVYTERQRVVILKEKDENRAARLFSMICENDIQREIDNIKRAKERIEEVKERMEMVEQWRKSHEEM